MDLVTTVIVMLWSLVALEGIIVAYLVGKKRQRKEENIG